MRIILTRKKPLFLRPKRILSVLYRSGWSGKRRVVAPLQLERGEQIFRPLQQQQPRKVPITFHFSSLQCQSVMQKLFFSSRIQFFVLYQKSLFLLFVLISWEKTRGEVSIAKTWLKNRPLLCNQVYGYKTNSREH